MISGPDIPNGLLVIWKQQERAGLPNFKRYYTVIILGRAHCKGWYRVKVHRFLRQQGYESRKWALKLEGQLFNIHESTILCEEMLY